MERLDQIKSLLSRAEATDKKKFGRAFGKMNAQELLFESPFPTIELLQRQEDSVENYFFRNTSDYDGGMIPILRIAIPEIRYLRRCLGYLLICEGWFEEAAKFFYRLSGIINSSQPEASETEDYVARVRYAKCPRLVEGYSSAIRNAIAHAHVRLDRKHFTFTNPRNKATLTINYSTFMRTYYQPMSDNLELWMLITALGTLETVGTHQFRRTTVP